MNRALILCLAVVFVVIMLVNFLTMADQISAPVNATAMTYTEWCQHMDQLSQNLRIAMRNFWIRGSIDFAVELVGLVILARPLSRAGAWGWQQVVGGVLILAGAVDGFVYTVPPATKAALDYKMWKEAGASRMWLYPCTASAGDR